MYNEWSLNVLYEGIHDPKLAKDMERLQHVIEIYKEKINSLKTENPAQTLRSVIEISEEMSVLTRRLMGYFSLRRSADSADSEGAGFMTKIQKLAASTAKESVMFQKYVGSLENLDEILESDELLCQYKFYFHQMKEAVSHKIGDEAEAVFAQMNISGGRAWSDLVAHLTASVEVDYKGEKTTLSAIRGLAESDDSAVLKAAY